MLLAKDTGFLLRKISFSESSFILKAFTRSHGLISLMAKGAKRPGSRLRGLLEPVLHLQLLFPEFSRSELRLLSEVSLLRDFPELRRDPAKQALAQVFGEIILRYPPGESDAAEFHDLLLEAEADLESLSGYEVLQARLCAFLLRFCHLSGFQPQFRACFRCGAPISDSAVHFYPDQGGPACGRHREGSGSGAQLLREATVRWLDGLQAEGEAPHLGRTESLRAENFLLHYLGRHTGGEKTLKSLPVWHALIGD